MKLLSNIYDTHMHTLWSGDSEELPEAEIQAAKQKGLGGLIFTDHMDLDYQREPHLFDLDVEHYLPEMRRLAEEQSTEDFEVLVGIEIGMQAHVVEENRKLMEQDFDYVIGSIHVVDGDDPYYESFYEGITVQDAYRRMLETTLENIKLLPEIDTLGHLDYITRYSKRYFGVEESALRYEDYPELLDQIFDFLIQNEICLEVNTSPYREATAVAPNPSWELLKKYYDMGGRRITIGADAHVKENVGLYFPEVIERLKEIGFEGFYVFHRREAQFVKFA